jgi:arylsulfatase A-like enzyme
LAATQLALAGQAGVDSPRPGARPNVLFLMADQFRFDAIPALGNPDILRRILTGL